MLGLRELQRAFATSLVSGDTEALAALVEAGPIAPSNRLRIHRNTMLGALAGALKLAYPAVEALVGPEFFEQAAKSFAQISPPRAALLTLYGASFPAFLEAYPLAAGLPYLSDVARLEWAVELAARGPIEGEARMPEINLGAVTLTLAPSLARLDTAFPAEPIWRAVLDGDDDALARIDPAPSPSRLAIWRDRDGAAVTPLGLVASTFLDRLLAGADGETALADAALADPEADTIAAISAEILQAGFTRIRPIP